MLRDVSLSLIESGNYLQITHKLIMVAYTRYTYHKQEGISKLVDARYLERVTD